MLQQQQQQGTEEPLAAGDGLARALRSQTRLNGVIKAVSYTDETNGTGTVFCLELKREFNFSCKAITPLKADTSLARRQAVAMDRCTFKLSEKNGDVRATSIRLKNRVVSAPGESIAARGGSSSQQSEVPSIYDWDSPLNSLEYAPALASVTLSVCGDYAPSTNATVESD